MHANETYDAVVIGGGPAGSAAAITFARAGHRVLLAEATSNVPFKIGESLPPSAAPLLRDLGALAVVQNAGHLPCSGIVAAWGGAAAVERDFIRELHGSGWHLDRPRFDADLRTLAVSAGAVVRMGCSFARWNRDTARRRWELRFMQQGEQTGASAPWVVDATGRRALIARHYGGDLAELDPLVALCVEVDAGGGTDARTFIEAEENGWWYSALLPRARRIVAFFTDEDLPLAREMTEPGEFLRRLAQTTHVRALVGEVPLAAIERVRRFPAGGAGRRVFGGDGWIAVGDSSLAFDPLSSQGIFHALYTGLRGAQAAIAAHAGDAAALPEWNERLRAIEAAYRAHHEQIYFAEARWPNVSFWRRRRSKARRADAGGASLSTTEHRRPLLDPQRNPAVVERYPRLTAHPFVTRRSQHGSGLD